MKLKVLQKKLKIFTALLGIFFVLLVLRLAYMQVFEVDRYRTLATQNHQRMIAVEAPRGEILDKNDVRIVSNKPVYTVSLAYLGMKDNEDVIENLAKLLSAEEAFQDMSQEQISEEIRSKLEAQKVLYEPVKLATNVSQRTVNLIEEMTLELPGVTVDVEPVRYYPYQDLFGDVLGYVREITAEELKLYNEDISNQNPSLAKQKYVMGDRVGKVGLEKYYEQYLRGEKGARKVEVDAYGKPVRDLGMDEAVPGNNLKLTVDSRLQRVVQTALTEGLARAKYLGYGHAHSGEVPKAIAVVQDVRTGAVLAMAYAPSYDLNVFSGNLSGKVYEELVKSGALKNHAIQSVYAPGSTFKMATLTSFLESGKATPSSTIYDTGRYKTKNDWKAGGHGNVDPVRAIKYSCDTFFYIFGEATGPEIMGQYAKEYGFGQLTGIDLPGEEKGVIASKERKKELWGNNPDKQKRDWESQWHDYDSMDMAIGQQETKVTALQLVNYTSALANGGTLYRPYLVDQVISPDGTVLLQNEPQVLNKVSISEGNLKLIQKGMHEVTTVGGTGYGIFSNAYSVAAKSGTAEVTDKVDNTALFVAYAPFDKPEVAVSVIVEYGGGGGSVAGPVAKDILNAYFELRDKPVEEEEVKPTEPSNQSQSNRPVENSVPSSLPPVQLPPVATEQNTQQNTQTDTPQNENVAPPPDAGQIVVPEQVNPPAPVDPGTPSGPEQQTEQGNEPPPPPVEPLNPNSGDGIPPVAPPENSVTQNGNVNLGTGDAGP